MELHQIEKKPRRRKIKYGKGATESKRSSGGERSGGEGAAWRGEEVGHHGFGTGLRFG